MSQQDPDAGRRAPAYTMPWIIGSGLILMGILSLMLMLGWFRYMEMLALAGGVGILATMFLLYGRLEPDQAWIGWASYTLYTVAVMLAGAFIVDYRLLFLVAGGVILLALPFLVFYVRRSVLGEEDHWWWVGMLGGVLISSAVAIIQFQLDWPGWLLNGIVITIFMGGVTLTMYMVWAFTRDKSGAGWMVGLMIFGGLSTVLGILITTQLTFLAIPLLLLAVGAFFMVRFVVMQWQHEQAETLRRAAEAEQAAMQAAAPPTTITPYRPELPAGTGLALPERTAEDTQNMLVTGLVTSPGPQVIDLDAPPPPPDSIPEAPPDGLPEPPDVPPIPGTTVIRLQSPIMADNGPIPRYCTCDGANQSPPLAWPGIPAGTQSLAVLMEDTQAPQGVVTHWLVYNLPPSTRTLPPRIEEGESTPAGGMQGQNNFRRTGYDGPCPPPDREGTYTFRLYALNSVLDLSPGATRQAFNTALRQAAMLATGELTVHYRRLAAPDGPPTAPR